MLCVLVPMLVLMRFLVPWLTWRHMMVHMVKSRPKLVQSLLHELLMMSAVPAATYTHVEQTFRVRLRPPNTGPDSIMLVLFQ